MIVGKAKASKWLGKCAVFAALLVSGVGLQAQAQGALPPELAQAWAKTKLPESSLSVLVQEVGGPRLFAISPETPRNPASVMKLVTTYAAISRLGPNYVWNTSFLLSPDSQISDQGVLKGPLYLRAGGDPVLMLQDVWRLLRDLRLRGIREISDIVVDRSIFGEVTIDPGAFDGASDRPYNASPDAFMVGFGAVRLVFSPDPASKTWKSFIDPHSWRCGRGKCAVGRRAMSWLARCDNRHNIGRFDRAHSCKRKRCGFLW